MSQTSAARTLTAPLRAPHRPGRAAAALRVVRPPARGRSGAGTVVLCVGLLVAGLLTLLGLNIALAKGSYHLYHLQSDQTRLRESADSLKEQLDDQAAPQRLAAQAARLGMVPAPNTAFLDPATGTIIGEPAPAKAPPAPTVVTQH